MFFEKENESKEKQKRAREEREKRLVKEVVEDFERRREARRKLEDGWVLNMNFLSGNQYCDVSPFGGVEEQDKRFYWQSRRVFNHVAPTVDSRTAKLAKLKPNLRVRAFSDEDADVNAAKLATAVLAYVQDRIGMGGIIDTATVWSEVCGSVFYKVVWDEDGGRKVGVKEDKTPIFEGEVIVSPVSPFEIFPDDLGASSLREVHSLIHAQTVRSAYVLEKFGVAVQGEDSKQESRAYSEPTSGKQPWQTFGENTLKKDDCVLVIERYTRPTIDAPNGKLEIVAGDKLVYEGELPYKNGARGERDFPFIKQDSIRLPGAFFGVSVVDRLIPVQRAYNAVRNRKHEFLNRLSMGVITVEDGAIDTDDLLEDGLAPGKVLVYRQGAKPPETMDSGNIPAEFGKEEAWLEQEFALVSGVSELSQNSTPTGVTSGVGLQLLLSQDESRLSATVQNREEALREVARHILRLYREFAGSARLMTMVGENKKVQVHYFNAEALSASDVVFETEDLATPFEKRETLLKLLNAGVLYEEDGKISKENRIRFLEAFGFGSYENAKDISFYHVGKAMEENLTMQSADADVDFYDDDNLHKIEHTRFLLSEEFKKLGKRGADVKARVVAHLRAHLQQSKQKENG